MRLIVAVFLLLLCFYPSQTSMNSSDCLICFIVSFYCLQNICWRIMLVLSVSRISSKLRCVLKVDASILLSCHQATERQNSSLTGNIHFRNKGLGTCIQEQEAHPQTDQVAHQHNVVLDQRHKYRIVIACYQWVILCSQTSLCCFSGNSQQINSNFSYGPDVKTEMCSQIPLPCYDNQYVKIRSSAIRHFMILPLFCFLSCGALKLCIVS